MNVRVTREQFIDTCDRVMVFSFYALIYFLPISIALSEMFTGIALGFYLFKRTAVFIGRLKERPADGTARSLWGNVKLFLGSYKPVDNCLNWPIAVLLFFSFISVLVSQFPPESLNGFLGKVLQSTFLYFNFIECINSKKRLRVLLTVFLVSITLITINAFAQSLTGKGFIFGHEYYGRMTSSFRSANDFGAYLVIVIPFLFSLSFFSGAAGWNKEEAPDDLDAMFAPSLRIGWTVLFLVSMACLGMTYSRGAWLGFILSLFAIGTVNRRHFILFSMIGIVFIAVFYPRLSTERIPIYDKRTFLHENNRLNYWKRATGIIKDYPLFGSGINTYALVQNSYSVGWGGYPHNSFLQMAAETGLFGLGAFMWVLITLFRQAFRNLKRLNDRSAYKLLFGLIIGLLGFLIHSFFDTNLYSVKHGSMMWLMFGIIVVIQKIALTPQEN